jgi:hypothetical protein
MFSAFPKMICHANFRHFEPKAVHEGLLLAACTVLLSSGLFATTYHVDASKGDDSNPGTSTNPFKTIQRAADVMSSGDICEIRTGIYRETVTPKADNLTFRAASGTQPTISGADAISGWSLHSGKIYKAPMGWDLGKGKNQIFVNGQMMLEARWPNTPSLDPVRSELASCDSGTTNVSDGTTGTLVDAELPNVNLTEATLHIGSGYNWSAFTATVTSQAQGQISLAFHYPQKDSWYRIRGPFERWGISFPGNSYFLTGTLPLLDSAGEWYFANNTVYLWSPDNALPQTQLVEAKVRNWGFNLEGRSQINIEGINLFACGLITNASTNNCTIKKIKAEYVNHFTITDFNRWATFNYEYGVVLDGANNSILDSEIAFAANSCVTLKGTQQTVKNCQIHDAGYGGALGAPLMVASRTKNHVISYNTIFNASREVIFHHQSYTLTITHNNLYNAGLEFDDGGVTYCFDTDGRGTEIAYNLIHDNYAHTRLLCSGIYLDGTYGKNFSIHHNVIWGVGVGMTFNGSKNNILIYNNTVDAERSAIGGNMSDSTGGDASGTILRNNILLPRDSFPGVGHTADHNLDSDTKQYFVDASNHNYQLTSQSPAIDAGTTSGLSLKTDILGTSIPQGGGPDIGAYEYTDSPAPTRPAAPTGLRVLE